MIDKEAISKILADAYRFRTCFHKLEYKLAGMNECICSDEKCNGYDVDCLKYITIQKI